MQGLFAGTSNLIELGLVPVDAYTLIWKSLGYLNNDKTTHQLGAMGMNGLQLLA